MTKHTHQSGTRNVVLGGQDSPHGALVAQLDLMIRARYPLLYIVATANNVRILPAELLRKGASLRCSSASRKTRVAV